MKNKLFSIFTALAMVLGILVSPFTSAHAAAEEVTEKVTLHKLIMDKTDLESWDSEAIKEKGYDGSQNTKAFEALLGDHSAREVAGVYFAVKYNSGDNNGKYVTINETDKENPEYGAVDSLDAQLPDGFKLLAGETKAEGIEFNTRGLKGNFTIEEIHEKSTYFNNGDKKEEDKGKVITDSRAVPVEITLPLVNDKGVVKEAHVYPKNTEDKPQIDKNFLKDNELTKAEEEAADKLKVGAAYENYQAKKSTAKAQIGRNIPYEVKTEIPAKSNLAEAKWDDKMTEGLTYNKGSLKVTIDGTAITPTEEELTETDDGFVLRLKGDNLAKLNGKDKAVTVELKYSATVNNKAIVDIPEANDITFHYGNNPSEGNTPIPTKPNENGDLTVNKTWADGVPAAGEWAEFKLVNAQTGEEIGTVRFATEKSGEGLETTTTYTPNAAYKKIGNEKDINGPETKTEKGNVWSFTWTGLDKELQYKVIEDNNMNETATFTKGNNGEILVTNNKDNNPKPLNPTEPKVVNGGKKFVKTNQDGKERLAGAEFFVKNAQNQYLVAKAPSEKDAVKTAKEALDAAVKKYNDMDAETQKSEEGQKAKADVDAKQKAYNEAVLANATEYTWEAAPAEGQPDNRVVLTSDKEGKFEISGLEYGSYKLEEKEAPKGYAKLNKTAEQLNFIVAKGSYAGDAKEFKYEVELAEGETQTYGQQIKNKKVTIPETGGIGSLIFVVAGLAIMAFAYTAYKKSQYQEA